LKKTDLFANIATPCFLSQREGSDTEVKITDFGWAKKILHANSLTTVCGTEGFAAPEIIEHTPEYDVECDVWSLGVVIYIVLGGYRPFRGEGEECMEKIRYGEYKFHQKYWSTVSDDAKRLISRMLTVDVTRRITAAEALESDWILSAQDDERKPRKSKGTKKTSGKKKKSTSPVTSKAPEAPVRATEDLAPTEMRGSGRVSAAAAMFDKNSGADAKPFKFY
jgi:serine/threonine protein kinase